MCVACAIVLLQLKLNNLPPLSSLSSPSPRAPCDLPLPLHGRAHPRLRGGGAGQAVGHSLQAVCAHLAPQGRGGHRPLPPHPPCTRRQGGLAAGQEAGGSPEGSWGRGVRMLYPQEGGPAGEGLGGSPAHLGPGGRPAGEAPPSSPWCHQGGEHTVEELKDINHQLYKFAVKNILKT